MFEVHQGQVKVKEFRTLSEALQFARAHAKVGVYRIRYPSGRWHRWS